MENNERDPEKFHTLSKNQKKILIVLGLFVLLVIVPILAFQYYKFALNRPAQNFDETTFEISEGETVTSVADRLGERDLVNSEFLFKAYVVSEGLHRQIEAGVYRIPAGSSIKALAEIFQHGTNDRRVTFIEGWRVEQYAVTLSENFEDISYETFVEMAKPREGYLFPDTYFFNLDISEQEVVDKLTETFNQKTDQLITPENLEELGMTEDQLIIFSSIVEREVSNNDDREIVAGILINRWENGQALEADATTQYAVAIDRYCSDKNDECPTEDQAQDIDWWPDNLTVSEIESESPYNTRQVAGLPPSPIANPSLSSIEAVINHRDTAYNYYLTDENGVTRFANTLEEHIRNINEYLN